MKILQSRRRLDQRLDLAAIRQHLSMSRHNTPEGPHKIQSPAAGPSPHHRHPKHSSHPSHHPPRTLGLGLVR